MEPKFGKDLIRRLIFGSLSLAFLIVVVVLAPFLWFRPIFAIGVALVAAIALWEYYRLCTTGGYRPAIWSGVVAAILYIAIHFWQTQGLLIPFASPLALGVAFFALFTIHLFRQAEVLGNLATTIFGLLYVAVPMSLLLDLIYFFPAVAGLSGWWWFFFLVGVTVLTDMGGYFVGKGLGRRKLAPRLSPNKTIEGAIGGVVFGVGFAILWRFADPTQASWGLIVIMGLLLSLGGQLGDLLESRLKRDVGVKDSNTLPGLGGMLDVLDSLFLNIPLLYLILRITYRGVL
ncbi:MAG: phosphatidate cytidylyltransferase [Verrucomicrobia bacterium]|nr:phosphatidate cytidylyltransferase [Verrucomicrobiota bacterium]